MWRTGLITVDSAEILDWCLRELSKGRSVALITVIGKEGSGPRDPGAMMAVSSTGEKTGSIGGGDLEKRIVEEALDSLRTGRVKRIRVSLGAEKPPEDAVRVRALCGGVIEVFINVINPKPRVIIVGAGHVGKPVADIGNILGYRVVVLDSDPRLASRDRYPYAEQVLVGDVVEELEKLELTDSDVLVVVYGDPEVDYRAVRNTLKKGFKGPIWVLCSRRRAEWMLSRLKSEGFDIEQLKGRLHMPAGLDIGSDTPEEIAVSIWSEVICEARKCSKPVKSLSAI
ncbi:MAG: XdhC/CoxI family protein [Desulfurococcaceae archaeon]